MSDYFRFYCDGLDEPRLLYAMHRCAYVPLAWLWILCECARTKRNQIEQPSNAMLVGLQHKLNVPPGSLQVAFKLLVEIEYLEDKDGFYIVRKWNDLQSKYMQEQEWKRTHRNQKEPKGTKNPIGEERRGEEKREEKKSAALPPIDLLPECIRTPQAHKLLGEFIEHRKTMKKPMSELSLNKTIAKLARMGHADACAAMENSIANSWQGIFEPSAPQKKKHAHANI